MAATQRPHVGIYSGWALGENGWHTGMEINLRVTDALLGGFACYYQASPPGVPTDGMVCVVATGGAGDFAGHDDDIAIYRDDVPEWIFITPTVGITCYDLNANTNLIWSGAAWYRLGYQLQEADADLDTGTQGLSSWDTTTVTMATVRTYYTVIKGNVLRSGLFTVTWDDDNNISYFEEVFTEIGDTSDITFGVTLNVATVEIAVTAASDDWHLVHSRTFEQVS